MARRPALVVLLAAFASCTDAPSLAAFAAYDALSAGTGSGSTSGGATSTGDTTEASPASEADTDDAGEASGEGSTTTAAEAELTPPRIVSVDVPASVYLAGPVPVEVRAEQATDVRGELDGVELQPFTHQGGGVWLGLAPIYGSIDNGAHTVEVRATNGPLADVAAPVLFEVSAPAPGGQAWATVAPMKSTTRRAVVTPEGDLIEVGAVDVGGKMKPSLRKRSALNGSELWTVMLDEREGSADAVALSAGGGLWIALNVKSGGLGWQPRIVQVDAEGQATGLEVPTEPGSTVRGVADDGAGGVVAVGFAVTAKGDSDVVFWWMRSDGAAVHSAKPWDYRPTPNQDPHKFDDLAFDVVVAEGLALVIGASSGEHDDMFKQRTRGIVVRLDVESGAPLGPPIVADPVAAWPNSMFLAGAPHPDGVIVTGNESTDDGATQRITVQVFNEDNGRTYYKSEWSGPVAYGSGVAWSAQGVALVAGVVHEGTSLRGVLYGRGGLGTNFDYLFPGTEPSAARGLVLDAYEQAFVVGEIGDVPQARAARVHR